ncbi:glycosyltransferase family protein [Arthrobacter pigmenti]
MKNTSSPDTLQHFMVTWGIGTEFGGMTTMCLYRAEIFRRLSGITVPVLTFDPLATYDETRERLFRTGLLHPDTPVLNLYEYYRSLSFANMDPLTVPHELDATVPDDVTVSDANDTSGHLFSSALMSGDGTRTYRRRYFRTDGSIFAQDETPTAGEQKQQRLISLFNHAGQIVKQYSSAHTWYGGWLDMLVAARPSVFIVDSGTASRFMAKYHSPYAIKTAVYHSNHVASAGDPYRGELAGGRKHIAEKPHEWDGIVFLTEQQRQDFIARFGETQNLFTVSNPRSRLAEPPDPAKRQRNRGVMLCRLTAVKNIPMAIKVIELVRKTVPDILLDIYGDGPLREVLQLLIERRGLDRNVALRGYAANAVNELETSTFSLLTSKFEGQPLSVMESQARGCPPVAVDVRYGPQDLIQDENNGFLVPAGDVEAAADRVIELCRSPDRAAEMSRSAWESSQRFDDQAVLDAWRSTINVMWDQRGDQSPTMRFDLERIDIEVEAGLSVYGTVRRAGDAGSGEAIPSTVELQAMPRTKGRPMGKPMQILHRNPAGTRLKGTFDQADLDEIATGDDQQIEFFVIATRGKRRSVTRIPFGNSADVAYPYPTILLNMSLKSIP